MSFRNLQTIEAIDMVAPECHPARHTLIGRDKKWRTA